MKSVVTIAIVGLGAQLVDGTLGMAYGVTSTTLLLTAGYSPAIASASVHLAEIGTTLASGVYLLLRFATRLPVQKTDVPPRKRFLAPLGLFAGFIDATGGGGWGPVAT